MNVDYDAAEFLVNVIAKSPGFCIPYDDLKMLVQQSNQAITAFFDIETKYDFILNKFSEIFILRNNMISFTDTYQSVYHLEKPSKSLSSYGLVPDMENCAILYFLKILNLHGPQQYLNLFNMLMNDRTQACSYYFSNYADLDMFNFFTSNTEYFMLNNDIVRAKESILNVLYGKENHAKKRLHECVCFLLKYFGSFHYFELSKCICYGNNCCETFLKHLSLLKQREHFENLPDTEMDKYGFLSLKNKNIDIELQQTQEKLLLNVCILAFKKEMHFKDLIRKIIEKSERFSLLMSKKNQLMFFKKYTSYFIVSEDGFVKLLPTFSLPKCSFEDLTSEAFKQITSQLNNIKVNESLISYQDDIRIRSDEVPRKKITVEKNFTSVHPELNKIQNNSNEKSVSYQNITSNEEPMKKKMKVGKNISSVHLELNKIQNNSNETLICYQNITSANMPKKRKNAFDYHVWFVLKCRESNAVPMHYFELRKCISYAETRFNLFLSELSEAEQREYFETIPNTVMDQYGFIRLKKESVKMPILNDRKKYNMMIVLTVCILAFRIKMHFTYLVYEAVEKSNLSCNFFQSIERQFQFFNDNCSVFVVSYDGFVQLSPTFMDFVPFVRPEMNKIRNNSPNETISFQDNITLNEEPKKRRRKCKRKEKVEMDISSVLPELSKIQSNSSNGTFSSNQNDIESDEEPNWTRGVQSALNNRVCFVLKCFELMHFFELRECISFAEDGVKNFLNRFSELEQKNYFENIPNTFMDQNGFLSLKNKNFRARFSRRSRIKLLTVCILAFGKKMHFKDLVNEALAKSNICCDFFKSTEDQRKFFEKCNSIFVVSKDGFVKLLPTFMLRRYSFEELSIAFWKTKLNDCAKVQNNTLINSCVHSVPIESSLPSDNIILLSD